MFELREYDQSSNRIHVWFQLYSKEEAIQIMLNRCFGGAKVFKSQNEWTGCDIYEDPHIPMVLFQRYKKRDIYDFDNTIGPSTEFVYEICQC
jgi:hypothetical protein